MNKYSEFCVTVLELVLNSESIAGKLQNDGIKDVLKLLVRLYPEINVEDRKTHKRFIIYEDFFRISERALEELNKKNTKNLHMEHLFTVIGAFNEIIALKSTNSIITKKQIKEVLDKMEIVILTKEEKDVLDGSKDKTYYLDGKRINGFGLRKDGDIEKRSKALEQMGVKLIDNRKVKPNLLTSLVQ